MIDIDNFLNNDDIMTSLLKKSKISIKIHVVKPLRSLFGEFPNCRPNPSAVVARRELVANCVHTADADATKQFRRVGVVGVYWALRTLTVSRSRSGDVVIVVVVAMCLRKDIHYVAAKAT